MSSFNHIAVSEIPTSYLLTTIPEIPPLYSGHNNSICVYSISLEHIIISQLVLAILFAPFKALFYHFREELDMQ